MVASLATNPQFDRASQYREGRVTSIPYRYIGTGYGHPSTVHSQTHLKALQRGGVNWPIIFGERVWSLCSR